MGNSQAASRLIGDPPERRGNNKAKIMFYLYAIESLKNKRIYIGSTGDIKKRILEHNSERGSIYTKKNTPFKLIFYEAFIDKKDAQKAEKFFKTGYGREVLKDKLENYFKKSLE